MTDIDLDAIRERAVLCRANQMQHEKTYDRATALTAAAFLCAQDVPALLSALTATRAERDEARSAVLELGDAIIRANGWEPQNAVTVELSSALERLIRERDTLACKRDLYFKLTQHHGAEADKLRAELAIAKREWKAWEGLANRAAKERNALRARYEPMPSGTAEQEAGPAAAPQPFTAADRERWLEAKRMVAEDAAAPKPDEPCRTCRGSGTTWTRPTASRDDDGLTKVPCTACGGTKAAGAGDGEQDTATTWPTCTHGCPGVLCDHPEACPLDDASVQGAADGEAQA